MAVTHRKKEFKVDLTEPFGSAFHSGKSLHIRAIRILPRIRQALDSINFVANEEFTGAANDADDLFVPSEIFQFYRSATTRVKSS
jgi:hypothetical protein